MNLLGLSWIVDVDIMTKSNGEPAVIEINPRISGSAVVSMIAGVPLYKCYWNYKIINTVKLK